MLLEAGAEVNTLSYQNTTPLALAVSGGCVQCVGLVLAAGGNPEIRDNTGETLESHIGLMAHHRNIPYSHEDKLAVVHALKRHQAYCAKAWMWPTCPASVSPDVEGDIAAARNESITDASVITTKEKAGRLLNLRVVRGRRDRTILAICR